MRFVFFQQSGKLADPQGSPVWALAGASIAARHMRGLQRRLAGVNRAFRKPAEAPASSLSLCAPDLMRPRNAGTDWSRAYLTASLRVFLQLEVRTFLVVMDRRTAEEPVAEAAAVPFAWRVLLRSLGQHLAEERSYAMLVLPAGYPPLRRGLDAALAEASAAPLAGMLAGTATQDADLAPGMQMARFAATAARRYFVDVAALLAAQGELSPEQSAVASAYLGFVKKSTWQGRTPTDRGVLPRGFHYFWRREKPAAPAAQ
ncbi:MAG: hypothetical protein SF028_00220 [Candidatus Sumerlaeia bacterium]|nr:hypothetical protein [Candidatus Sumerlaeia bacterium]